MDAIGNQLRRDLRALCCRTDYARRAVEQGRHGIVEVRYMRCACSKRSASGVIIRFRMCDGNGYPCRRNALNQRMRARKLRRNAYDADPPACRLLKARNHGWVWGAQVGWVLRPTFSTAEERAFHGNAAQRGSVLWRRCAKFRRRMIGGGKLLLRQREGCLLYTSPSPRD